MNIFALLTGFAILGMVLVTLVAFVCILWFGRKRSWRLRGSLLGIVCLPFMGFMLLLSWLSGPVDITDPRALKSAFEGQFGSAPTVDVNSIQCRVVVVGDAGAEWLRFNASPQTVDALRKRFSVSTKSHFMEVSDGGNTPPWWQPESQGMVTFYSASDWHSHFQHSEAVMAHNAAKDIVYFCHEEF
jgi:hypothetical protein